MGKVISLSNHKGGVGKTCSAVNIGAGISKHGKHVLLIDLDPQANLSLSFGIKEAEYHIYGALTGKYSLSTTIHNISDHLQVIPSHLDLSGAEVELSSAVTCLKIIYQSKILKPPFNSTAPQIHS